MLFDILLLVLVLVLSGRLLQIIISAKGGNTNLCRCKVVFAYVMLSDFVTDDKIFTMEDVQNGNEVSDDESEELKTLSVEAVEVILYNRFPELQGFGLDISGGKDRPFMEGEPGIFVSGLKPNGIAEKSGKIDVGDKVLQVNGENIACVTHAEAVKLFKSSRTEVKLCLQKYAGQILQVASLTPTPTSTAGSFSPDSDRSVSPRRERRSTEYDNGLSISGFMLGLAIGCVTVVVLKRYLSSKT